MPSMKTLAHFPPEWLDWLEMVAISGQVVDVPLGRDYQKAKLLGAKWRGKWYQFVGVLRKKAASVEQLRALSKRPPEADEQRLVELAGCSQRVAAEIRQIDGEWVVSIISRDNTWVGKMSREARVRSAIGDEVAGMDEAIQQSQQELVDRLRKREEDER